MQTLPSAIYGRPWLIGRRTKIFEFLDDDLGFVDLDSFSQPLEFLQTVMLRR
jgi:hypothetical protein